MVSVISLAVGLPPHSPIFKSWLHCWNYLSHKGHLFRGSSFFFRRVPVTSLPSIEDWQHHHHRHHRHHYQHLSGCSSSSCSQTFSKDMVSTPLPVGLRWRHAHAAGAAETQLMECQWTFLYRSFSSLQWGEDRDGSLQNCLDKFSRLNKFRNYGEVFCSWLQWLNIVTMQQLWFHGFFSIAIAAEARGYWSH